MAAHNVSRFPALTEYRVSGSEELNYGQLKKNAMNVFRIGRYLWNERVPYFKARTLFPHPLVLSITFQSMI